MESVVKKYQQKFRKVRDDISKWEGLQSRLISQFTNVSSIIMRLQVIQDPKNYGVLKCCSGIEDMVLAKQTESLQNILISMNKTLEDFNAVVLSLEKILRDGKQLVKGGSTQATMKQLQLRIGIKPTQATMKQLQLRIGIKPTLAECLDGLTLLHHMHQSEYLLISSVISTLPALILNPRVGDLGSLQQLLVDQPNIPKEEVQFIFDIIFAEEIS